jgi:two-component system response regulator BaeR
MADKQDTRMTPQREARRVLLVAGDDKVAQQLLGYFRIEGFEAETLDNGQNALSRIEQSAPAVVVLDAVLPGLDGIGVCRAVRRFSDVPILMLTARIDEVDHLFGLDAGADDYVCKPFDPREVIARVRVLVRRADGRLSASAQPWYVDDAGYRIAWRGQWLSLTPLEFRLLRLMLRNPGRVFTRAKLLESVYSDIPDVSDRAIDSHVKNVRRKIQATDPGCKFIRSIYGEGYCFDAPA